MYKLFFILCSLTFFNAQAQTAIEIVQKADLNLRGKSSYSELSIDIIRPKWNKQLKLKGWAKGDDYSVSIITAPAKEKGTVFLMRKKEVWNYVPSIDRSIKFPPSMMLQNWMGTDLTNDDLVKQSSIVTDYQHKLLGTEIRENLPCWKIELVPKEQATVVWGKIIIWIDKKDYMQLQIDFYDEDFELVNQMIGSDVKVYGNKRIPSKLSVIPVDKKGQKTVITYNVLKFDLQIPNEYFTTNYMKKIR